MQSEGNESAPSREGTLWDGYVEGWPKRGFQELEWPGDEWGNQENWEWKFQFLFVPAGVKSWRKAVEVGQGSGKYTLPVLEHSSAEVRAYDVSSKFLEVCEERCRDQIDRGRLSLHLLDSLRPDELLSDLTDCGWRRQIDAFYSINAMVHVELQELIVYLMTAALVLKPGGKLVLTLADVTRPPGFEQLLIDVATHYRQIWPGRLKWLGPDIIRSVLIRLGFDVEVFYPGGLWILLSASLARPDAVDKLEQYLASPGTSPA